MSESENGMLVLSIREVYSPRFRKQIKLELSPKEAVDLAQRIEARARDLANKNLEFVFHGPPPTGFARSL